MFKYAIVIFALVACVTAKPGILHAKPLAVAPRLPFAAPAAQLSLAAPAPVITSTSSQVIARTHNGIAAAPFVAAVPVPVVTPLVTPFVAAPSAHLHYAAAAKPIFL